MVGLFVSARCGVGMAIRSAAGVYQLARSSSITVKARFFGTLACLGRPLGAVAESDHHTARHSDGHDEGSQHDQQHH
jgi:hypothetical protein